MKLAISEILKNASALKTKGERIEYLRANRSIPLMQILRSALDTTVVWKLPEGEPPYTPSSFLDIENRLFVETKRFYLFRHDPLEPLDQQKRNVQHVFDTTKKGQMNREKQFISLLESVMPADAKLLIAIKDKKFPYKGLTVEIVREAFPGLIGEASVEKTSRTPAEQTASPSPGP